MKNTKQARKLRLDRSTVRVLSTSDLRGVAGGGESSSDGPSIVEAAPGLAWDLEQNKKG